MNIKRKRIISMILMVMVLMTNISTAVFAGSIERRDISSMSSKTFKAGQYHNNSMYKSSELDGKIIPTSQIVAQLGLMQNLENKPNGIDIDDVLAKLDGIMPGFGSLKLVPNQETGKATFQIALIHNDRFAMEENGKETPIFCLSYGLPSLADAEKEGKEISVKPIEELRDIKDDKRIEEIKEILYLYSNDDELFDGLSELEKEWVTGLALYRTTGRIYNKANNEKPVIFEDDNGYFLSPEKITSQNLFTAFGEMDIPGVGKFFTKVNGGEEYVEEQKKLVDLSTKLIEKAIDGVDKGDAILRNSIGLKKVDEATLKDGNLELTFSVNSDDHKMLNKGEAVIALGANTIDNKDANINEKDFDLEVVEENGDTVVYKAIVKTIDGKEIDRNISSITVALAKNTVTQQILMEESGEYQDMVIPGINRIQRAISYKIGTEFEITKIDSEDENKVLEGAHFDVEFRGIDKNNIRLTTGKDGKASIFLGVDILSDSDFEGINFKEVKAPEGYKLNKAETFVSKEDLIKHSKVMYTVKNILMEKINIILNKTDLTTGEPVEGAKIEISSDDVEGFETIEYISDAEGKVSFELDKPGKYQFKETVAPDGYVLNEEVFEFEVYKEGDELKVKGDNTITNKPMDKDIEIVLNKTDLTTGEPVEGAKIEISSDDVKGFETIEYISDAEGKISFKLTKEGKYKFKETVAPEGYILNEEEFEFEVYRENGELKVKGDDTITNKPMAKVELSKTDLTTGEPVEGAKIEISSDDVEGFETIEYISDAEGKVSFYLEKPGKYKFKETVAPEGYVLNEEEFEFEVYEEDGVLKVRGDNTITNKPMDKTIDIVLNKTDLTTGKPVEGAVIEITSDDVEGFEPVTYTSDAEGKISFKLTKEGKYKFKETIAPEGYILNEEEFEFEVYRENGELKVRGDNTITNEPEPTVFDIKFSKRNYDTNEKLADYKFSLLNEDKEEIRIIESDNTEVLEVKDLEPGKYFLKEIVAPKGFEMIDEELSFTITEEGEIEYEDNPYLTVENKEEVVVYNNKLGLVLVKEDGNTGERLEGAVFEITKKGTDEKFRVESDENGQMNLTGLLSGPGSYEIREIVAPAGYERISGVILLELEANGEFTLEGSGVKERAILNFKIDAPNPTEPGPEDPEPEDPTPEDPTPEDPTPEEPTPEEPTPEDPTPEEPINDKPDGVVPKPDGEDYEDPEDDEYEYEYEYEYDDEDPEIVVDEEVQTGEAKKAFEIVRIMMLFMAMGIAVYSNRLRREM